MWGRCAEPLAEVDERDRAALVLQHALEKVRRLGVSRGRLVAQDALDLEDVEGGVLAGHLECVELYVVAAGHVSRAPIASRSRMATSATLWLATPVAQGSDSPV